MNTNLIGQTLLNQFRVEAFIASGGMGAVYRVWDLKRNVPLAMKVLHTDLADDPSVFKRFKREANALKKLAHPNIVSFYGLYQTSEVAFLLERYVDGPSLKEIIHERHSKPIPTDEVLIYLKALCAALGYAHANGVVHCDVKPGNVMIDQGGNIYLTDFGIARHSDSATTTLATVGTAAYMAPEQIRGEPVSPATDIYALGVMLFEMLTGQRPFKGDNKDSEQKGTTSEQIRYANLSLQAPEPRLYNSAIPQKLSQVILIALDKNSKQRYQSTQTLFADACFTAGIEIHQVANRITPPNSESAPSSIHKETSTNGQKWNDSDKNALSDQLKRRRRIIVFASVGLLLFLLFLGIGYKYLLPSTMSFTQSVVQVTTPSPKLKTEMIVGFTSATATKADSVYLPPTAHVYTPTAEPPTQEPYTPANTNPPVLTPTPFFGPIYFCKDRDCVSSQATIFPQGLKEVYFFYDYENMEPNMKYGRRWYVNGNLYLDYTCTWGADWPIDGTFLKRVYDLDYGLAPGEWRIETYIGGRLQATASFTVQGTLRYEKFLEGYQCNDTSPTLP